MTRLRVAATVVTARTRRPESSSARWASRAVAPVVRTSSQTTSEHGRSLRASAARAGARTAIEPTRLADRSPARQAGLVVHLTSLLEELVDADAMSAPPQSPGRRARHPEHGVVSAGTHDSRSGGHRHEDGDDARVQCARRAAAASTRPSGVASEKVPCSLCARIIARSSPSYSPPAKQAASPGGHGVGRTASGTHGQVALAVTAQGPAGRRTPDARRRRARGPARRRSCPHRVPTSPGTGAARRRLWTASRRPQSCGREAVSGRRSRPRPWTSCGASCRCC